MTPAVSPLTRVATAPRSTLVDLGQKPRARRRYRRAEKEALLASFVRSGVNAAQFCRAQGLHPATFSAWQKAMRTGSSSFAEVRVTEPTPSSPLVTGAAITIHLPQEVCLEVPEGLDPVWLGRVVQMLKAET